jgi:hypothetical protein
MKHEEDIPPEQNPIVWGIYTALAIGGTSWFVLEKTNYDSAVASGLVTGIVSIIVGVIAAYVTLRATNKAHEHALKMQAQNDAAKIKGVVQALHAELTCLWDMYEKGFHHDMVNLRAGEAFTNDFKLHQNYFSLFDSNNVFIGQISDTALRQSIVHAYLTAKSLIDSHHLNSKLQDEYNQFFYLHSLSPNGGTAALTQNALTRWKNYSEQLKTTYDEAGDAIKTALRLLDASEMLEDETR